MEARVYAVVARVYCQGQVQVQVGRRSGEGQEGQSQVKSAKNQLEGNQTSARKLLANS